MPLKVVFDTNVILRCISRLSLFSKVLNELFEGNYELWITNDILLEYEEKITENFSRETAESFIGALCLLPNVKKTDIYYHLQLITIDKAHNKFSDCAFAGNVHYLVTNDKHFNALKSVTFPSLNIVTLEEFSLLI